MELQLFSKGEWSIGRPIIAEENAWFKGKDVAASLGYADPRRAVWQHVDDDDKKPLDQICQGLSETVTPLNQQPHEVYINESGLYSLVLASTLWCWGILS